MRVLHDRLERSYITWGERALTCHPTQEEFRVALEGREWGFEFMGRNREKLLTQLNGSLCGAVESGIFNGNRRPMREFLRERQVFGAKGRSCIRSAKGENSHCAIPSGEGN